MTKKIKLTKKHGKAALYVVSVVAFITLGVVGTLKYQEFIAGVKQQGVVEYTTDRCEEYGEVYDNGTEVRWLECSL